LVAAPQEGGGHSAAIPQPPPPPPLPHHSEGSAIPLTTLVKGVSSPEERAPADGASAHRRSARQQQRKEAAKEDSAAAQQVSEELNNSDLGSGAGAADGDEDGKRGEQEEEGASERSRSSSPPKPLSDAAVKRAASLIDSEAPDWNHIGHVMSNAPRWESFFRHLKASLLSRGGDEGAERFWRKPLGPLRDAKQPEAPVFCLADVAYLSFKLKFEHLCGLLLLLLLLLAFLDATSQVPEADGATHRRVLLHGLLPRFNTAAACRG
jgi:hypothetical protein